MPQGFTSAADNPGAANALASAVAAAKPTNALPLIPSPPSTLLDLPGGLHSFDGQFLQTVEVRELTGTDEEIITKAQATGSFIRLMTAILRCGVVAIGGEPATDDLLRQLLVGDRDACVLGIRRATYGDVLELGEMQCPGCQDRFELSLTLDDFPIRRLEDPLQQRWTVKLRKGGEAVLRLPNGFDQEIMYADQKLSVSEQNTLLLSRAIISMTDPTGEALPVVGIASAKALGMADRKKIIETITNVQPGPRFEQLSHTCENCGREIPIVLSVWDLFLG